MKLPYEPSWRDQIAYRLASAALRLASPTYRALLEGAWRLGLRAAITPCPSHDWVQRGSFGDEWRECFLCGKQEDS